MSHWTLLSAQVKIIAIYRIVTPASLKLAKYVKQTANARPALAWTIAAVMIYIAGWSAPVFLILKLADAKAEDRKSIVVLSLQLRVDTPVNVGIHKSLTIIASLISRRITVVIRMESLVLGVTQLIPISDGSCALFLFVPRQRILP